MKTEIRVFDGGESVGILRNVVTMLAICEKHTFTQNFIKSSKFYNFVTYHNFVKNSYEYNPKTFIDVLDDVEFVETFKIGVI